MTSFGYRLNPRYAIKECLSCGTLYTRDCVCSKGNVEDKILVLKPPKNCARISETSSQSPPHINHCCYECGDPLDGIFCKRCTCKSCGKDAHIGYNYPPTVSVSSNPEPCNNQTIDELPKTLLSFHPTFHSEAESPFTLDSTPTYIDESPNVFNPPPQPPVYPWEIRGNNAYYGHYCTPQAPFIYPEPCYYQDFNFPQDFQNVPQQYPCCDDFGVTHEVHQCLKGGLIEFPCGLGPEDLSGAESPFTLDSTPTYVDESPNVFNPPPQPPVFPCEIYGNDAYYGHYCTPQAPFIYPEPCYNQDFNFP
nr:hypothetical protein [Tanacetum cinerariifolium]